MFNSPRVKWEFLKNFHKLSNYLRFRILALVATNYAEAEVFFSKLVPGNQPEGSRKIKKLNIWGDTQKGNRRCLKLVFREICAVITQKRSLVSLATKKCKKNINRQKFVKSMIIDIGICIDHLIFIT